MAQVHVEMTGDEAKLWASMQKITRAVGDQEKALGKVGSKSREVAKEQEALAAKGKAVFEATRTPMERQAAKLAQINELYKKGAIDVGTYSRAYQQVHGTVSKTGDALSKTGGMGQKAMDSIGGAAMGLLGTFTSITAAIGIATKAMTDMQAKAAEAGQQQQASRMGLGQLAQVAGSEAEMQALMGRAEGVYLQGGAGSMDEAARMVFAAKAMGAEDQLGLIGELKATGMVQDPTQLIGAIDTITDQMGAADTGDLRTMIAKGLGAQKTSETSLEELMTATGAAGMQARGLGIKDEEVMAAVAVAANVSKSAEKGGKKVGQFFESLTKLQETDSGGMFPQFDFKGKSLEAIMTELKTAAPDDAAMRELLGEGYAGYAALAVQPGKYDAAMNAIEAAPVKDFADTDELDRRLQLYLASPELRAARRAQQAKATEELSRKRLGIMANEADYQQKQVEAGMRAEGTNEWGIWAVQQQQGWERWAFGDEAYLGPQAPQVARPGDDNRFGQPNGAADLRRAADALQQSTRNFAAVQRPPALQHPDVDR